MSDYIERQNVKDIRFSGGINHDGFLYVPYKELVDGIKALPSADVIPYSIESDGTLIITVPKGTYKNLNRVLVEEDGTHWGGLYYAD